MRKQLLLFFSISIVCISSTSLGYGQESLLNKIIKINILNGSVETLLNELSDQGGFSFTCSNYLIDLNKKVYLRSDKQSVREFLDNIFAYESTDLEYLERENKIILKPKKVIKKFITISGQLVDEETKLPVVNSNINVGGTYLGTTSDNYGNYMLKLKVNEKGEKLILNYSHISYEGETVIVNTTQNVTVDLELQTKTMSINEISVFGKPQIAFNNKSYNIEDYELLNDKILLTVYETRKSKSKLFLIDDNQQFIEAKKIPGTPIGTFRDCVDDLYLITYYQPYKISVDTSGLAISNSRQNKVNRLNKPCAALGPGGYYYYYSYGPARLSVEYVYHNPAKDKDYVFRVIEDTLQLARYKDNPDELKDAFGNSRGSLADIDIGQLDKTWKVHYNNEVADTLYRPVYAPMFLIDNMLYIFNHVGSKIEVYNIYTNLINNIPISYHKNPGWNQQLYFDKKENRVYTHYQMSGYSQINEIDLRTGSLKAPFKITYNNIEKIQITDGQIYFLYSSKYSSTGKNKCLYQQRLF